MRWEDHTMLTQIKLIRLRAGRPQWEVARQAGIAPSRLSCIENGRVVARPDELERITSALGLTAGGVTPGEAQGTTLAPNAA